MEHGVLFLVGTLCRGSEQPYHPPHSGLTMQVAAMSGSEARPLIPGFQLTPGTRLGKFEVVRELASGGMGKIYVARDTLTDAVVALKVLIPAFDADPGRLERFKRELLIGWRLNHANIIHIYDIGEDAGFHFISMELLDGEDLRTLLDRQPRPDLTRVAGISLQMLAGLQFAHEQGIVHRDFKPQNVFLTHTGSVKLLDFGVAQALRISSLTTQGSMVGTPGYMSPEQATGHSDLDGRSDIYSWGVVLYEMLSARLPFRCDNPLGVAAAHVYEAPPPIRDLEPRLPLALAGVVMRCLAKDPYARYANVAELRHAFEAAMHQAGVPVGAVSAAIQNALTPGSSAPIGLRQSAILTRLIPKRLRDPGSVGPVPATSTPTPLAKRVLALGAVGLAAAAIWTAVRSTGYQCDAAERLEVGDFQSVQASILGAGGSGPSRMSRACSIQKQAGLALVNGQVEEASVSVRAALDLEPELVWANVMSGDLAARGGDLEAARRAYEKATRCEVGTAPERALAWARLARLALETNDLDGASRYLDEANRTGASIPEVHHLVAQVAAKRGDVASAAGQYEKALRIAPTDAVAQILLDDLHARQRNAADAERQRWIVEMVDKLDARASAAHAGTPLPALDWKAGDRPRVMAVLPLESGAAAAGTRAGLGDALRIALERSLAGLDRTKVVDREMLDHVLSEQLLAASSLADDAAARRAARILGVRYFVRPQLTRLDDTLVFNVRVIDVETSEIVASLSPEIAPGAKPAEIAAALGAEIANRI